MEEAIREDLLEDDRDMMLMDGFDDCEVGVVEVGGIRIMCYSFSKIVEKLKSQGMTYDDAVEYHYFNQRGAYVGEKTPCFLEDL